MAVTTSSVLRPSGDLKLVGVRDESTSLTGSAATRVDDGGQVVDYTGADDTTFIYAAAGIQWPNAYAQLALQDLPALGADQRIKQVRIRTRIRMNSLVTGDAAIVHAKLVDPQAGLGILPVGTSVEATGIDKFVTGSTTVAPRTGVWHPKPPPADGDEWTRAQVNRLRLDLAWYYGSVGVVNLRVTELYVDVDVRDRPAVASPGVTGASSSTRPTVTWAYAANADGDPQVAWQVKVFSSAQYGTAGFDPDMSWSIWDSGVRFGGDGQAPVGRDLANGGTYKAYIRAAADFNGGRWWSAWADSAAFTIGIVNPPAPTLTVVSDPTVPNLRNVLQFTAALNALEPNDSDFETGIGNWVNGGGFATVTFTSEQARYGTYSLELIGSGAAAPWAANTGNGGAGLVATRPGLQHTLAGYARARTTTRAWRLVLRWLDAAQGFLSQTSGSTVTDSTSAWTTLPAVTGTAPTNAVYVAAQLETTGTPANGESHFFDQLQLVPGATAPAWAPGFLSTSSAVIERAVATTDPRNLAGRQLYGGGDDTRDASGFYTTGATSRIAFDMLDRVRGLGSIRWEVEDTTSNLYFGWPDPAVVNEPDDYALPAVPGRVYTFSVYARTTGATFSSRLFVQAKDNLGNNLGTVGDSGVVTIGTSWARYAATITIPAGASFVRPRFENTAAVTGRKVWVDAAQWELGSAATDLTRPGGVGLDWEPVRGFTVDKTPVPDGTQSLVAMDHEVPPGHTVIYRAWVYARSPSTGETLSSPQTAYTPTLIDPPGSGQWVLSEVAPAPFLRGRVHLLGGRTYNRPEDVTVYHPLRPRQPGQVGQRPVALSDWVGGRDGTLQIPALSDDDFWFLDHLLDLQEPLWLTESQGGGRYIRLTGRDWVETRFRDKCANLADGTVLAANEYEHVLTLQYVEAERPPDNQPAAVLILDPSASIGGEGGPVAPAAKTLTDHGAAAATLSVQTSGAAASVVLTDHASAADTLSAQTGTPVFRSVGVAATASSVDQLQSVLPAGWQPGDLFLLDVLHTGTDTATITTDLPGLGWTLTANAKAGFGQLWRYSKTAAVGETAPVVAFSTASNLVVHITAVSNPGPLGSSLTAADTTAANTTPIAVPDLTVSASSLVVVGYGARTAAPPAAAVTPDPDYTERAETSSTNPSSASGTLEVATRGPTSAGTLTGDTWAPTLAARDVLVVTEVKAAAAAVNDYGYPSYATLMARPNRVDLATVHGADTYEQVNYGTGVGDFVTFNAEGWRGHPNGGKNGLKWFPSWGYTVGDMVEPTVANGFCYKVTTGGTSGAGEPAWPTTIGNSVTANGVVYKNVGAVTASNPNAFNSGTSTPSINGARQTAVLGSTPSTPNADVGRVDGLALNNTQELFPLDPYLWSWSDRKGLANGSDPNGTWTGPNLDEHAFRIHAPAEAGGAWATIIDGMVFKDTNDAVGIISQAGARTVFRNCLFLNVGDDSNESDYNNNSAEYYDCLFLNIYTLQSTTGGRDASAEQTLLKNCVVVFGHLPWKVNTTSNICPSVGLRNNTAVDGWYWAHGVLYKQPSANCPRFRMEDTQLFIPGYAAACRDGTGLSGATFASASNTTLRFGRGKAITAADGTAVPQAGIGLEDWNTASAFMPSGVAIVNDSSSGYETARDAAIQAWVNGTGGHNPHPQMAGFL